MLYNTFEIMEQNKGKNFHSGTVDFKLHAPKSLTRFRKQSLGSGNQTPTRNIVNPLSSKEISEAATPNPNYMLGNGFE
jgi:hypothetical protein